MSTYYDHTRRRPPSLEAGVDYYCPIGTPVRAAGPGTIFGLGGDVSQHTGRFITLDLDDGRRVRYLHLSRYANLYGGNRVERGQTIAYSGASGYGSEFFGAPSLATISADTGGPHVHTTLWAGHYYDFGRYPDEPTLDFEMHADEEDDMFSDDDRRDLQAVKKALGAGGLQSDFIPDDLTVLGRLDELSRTGALRPDQDNALISVYRAVFVGGGDAGEQSILARLIALQAAVGHVGPEALAVQLKASLDTDTVTELAKRLSE